MIDHIYLPVSDLKRSSEFYKKVLEPLGIDMPYKGRSTSHARFRHQ
jgi:Glyoxalase/Bleomycin resistance protein/Dioxygenase superfamily.